MSLASYQLSLKDALLLPFYSSYASRHFSEGVDDKSRSWVHYTLGTLESIPIVCAIVSLAEYIFIEIVSFFCAKDPVIDPTSFKMWKSSQNNCDGFASVLLASELARIINENSEEIYVDKDQLAKQAMLMGGTCTSMSMSFVEQVLAIFDIDAQDFEYRLYEHRYTYMESSPEFRYYQACFNAIRPKSGTKAPDLRERKIQRISECYNLTVEKTTRTFRVAAYDASKGFEIDRIIEYQKHLHARLADLGDLEDGVYFIRARLNSNEDFIDTDGHSLVYIKKEGRSFFYDPNYGLYRATGSDRDTLAYFLSISNCEWPCSQIQLFKIKSTEVSVDSLSDSSEESCA